MDSYTQELLTDIFNQFEQSEEGIYFFTGGECDTPPPVNEECGIVLEEIAKALYAEDPPFVIED
jgi:hypothetical protein